MNKDQLNIIKKEYFSKRLISEVRNKKNNNTEYNKKFKETEKFFLKSNYNKNKIIDYLKNYNKNGYIYNNYRYRKLKNSFFFKKNIKEVNKIIKKFSNSKTDIYELGSGYGRIIFSLLFNKFNNYKNFYACDINKIGLKIINQVSKKYKLKIRTKKYDFLNLGNINLIKKNSIIFTYNSVMCIPNLKKRYFEKIIEKNPKIVIHFEAVYMDKPKNSLQRLSNKYFNNCDYNKTFLNELNKLNKEKKINLKILKRKISSNILLNEKIIIWKPVTI